jgi:prephenate dehydratase
MAIAQSRKFFKQYPKIKLIEAVDTALSAKYISEKRLMGQGAISSDLAAKMYNLEILAPSIETNKKNYTRFLVLTNKNSENNQTEDIDKVSVCFSLPHNKGSLSQILSVFTFYDLNMTKIQSMPIVGKEFQYFFYVDLTFDNYERYQQCLSAIKPLVVDLQILGEYKYGIESLGNIHHQ